MSFFGWSEEQVRHMNGAKGWVWFNYARENQASIWGSSMELAGGEKTYPEVEFEMIKTRKVKQ